MSVEQPSFDTFDNQQGYGDGTEATSSAINDGYGDTDTPFGAISDGHGDTTQYEAWSHDQDDGTIVFRGLE